MNQVSDLESNDHATVSQTLAQCSMNTVHAPTSALIRVPLRKPGIRDMRKWRPKEEMGGNERERVR